MITTLTQLLNIKQDVAETFVASISNIFRYNVKDITDTLSQLDLDQLTTIHKMTFTEVGNVFPLYSTRSLKQRRVKDTVISDIIIMGFSLANGTPSKDLDKVLSKPNDGGLGMDDVSISEMSSLIQRVQSLSVELCALKVSFEALQKENEQWRDEIRQLKSERDGLSTDSATMSPVAQPSHVPTADVLGAADDIPTEGASDIANTAASTTTVNPNSVNRQSGVNSDASGESDSEGFILDSAGRRRRR